MAELVFKYPALRVRQSEGAPDLVLLSASAVDIHRWVGIPQKTRTLDGETIGFQRDDNPARIQQIASFYREPRNAMHNPILCAVRDAPDVSVVFEPLDVMAADAPEVTGALTITLPDLAEEPLRDLFRRAREALEARLPSLAGQPDPTDRITALRARVDIPIEADDQDSEDVNDDSGADFGEQREVEQSPQESLPEESHVSEFWEELRAREILLTQLGDQFRDDSFLGFGRDALEAYIRPIVLVDGQHRLLGAMAAAQEALNADAEAVGGLTEALGAGRSKADVEDAFLKPKARSLPISLLLDSSPGEHVFQFVVVNQKASPVRPALLATIISTSLSEDELEPVKDRLEGAGIPLNSSQAITYLARNIASPFTNLVARGLADEGQDLLDWSVLGQLVAIFRDLKGGRFYHDRKIDYADSWKRRFLEASKIVSNPEEGQSVYDAWREPDGPWRTVFIVFWQEVRDLLGNTDNPDAPNYWGRPRSSNLFNKPSLMTLATDFFSFLADGRRTIDSEDHLRQHVHAWLEEVDTNYFARDWRLKNVKKDATATRKQWSTQWFSYRRDPKALPRWEVYSRPYKEG